MSEEQQHEPREFEGEDLSDAVFWGVDLRRALFRDADLTGVKVFHAQLTDVDIDGIVERLVVNGVDVTDYVNTHDTWFPLRTMLRPADAAGASAAWDRIAAEWAVNCERAGRLGDAGFTESVNGEWSMRDTIRHLLFAIEKWFVLPLLGATEFSPIGLPNTGSRSFPWPGLDLSASPTTAEVLSAWEQLTARVRASFEALDMASLPAEVEVLENGAVPGTECVYVVLEESFEHLRYARRDLAVLEQRAGS
jgi:hypothetical protein